MSPGEDPASTEHPTAGRSASQRLSAADAERLIARHWAHPEAPDEQHALAAVFDSATAPATDQELAGEVDAVAEFVLATCERAARAVSEVRSRRGVGGRKWAITAGIVAVSVMGFSGAAVADALPGPVQELAHKALDAPAPPHPVLRSTPTPVSGRPARGPGAVGARSGGAKTKAAAGQGKGKAKTAPGQAKAKAKGKGAAKGNGGAKGNGNGQGKAGGNGNGNGGSGSAHGNGNGGTSPGQQKKSADASLTTRTLKGSPGYPKLKFNTLVPVFPYPAIGYPSMGHWPHGLLACCWP